MSGAAVTGAFLLAAGGALYAILGRHLQFARICLTVGVVGALIFTTLQIFPTGDGQARQLARYQPSSFAAAEALFRTAKGAPLVMIGNPFRWWSLGIALAIGYFIVASRFPFRQEPGPARE